MVMAVKDANANEVKVEEDEGQKGSNGGKGDKVAK